MLRGSVLALALLISSPIVWKALVDGTVSLETALIRFLVAVPVAALLLSLLRLAATRHDRNAPASPPDRT